MSIYDLDDRTESWFLQAVEDRWPEYFWYLVDWMFERSATRITVVEEGGRLLGASLLYDDRILQLRGGPEACNALMAQVSTERLDINVPLHFRPELPRYYRPVSGFQIVLMTMGRDELRLRFKAELETLLPEDAADISRLLREADPLWAEMSEERVRSTFNRSYWLGVREQGTLRSVGCALTQGPGFNLSIIATEPCSRGKGYATTVVSGLCSRVLEEVPYALIHVREDNHAAKAVYRSVGFRPYDSYYVMRGERIQTEKVP